MQFVGNRDMQEEMEIAERVNLDNYKKQLLIFFLDYIGVFYISLKGD